MSDLVDQLTFCTSTEFSSDLLAAVHRVPAAEAKRRGKRLALHVTTALSFVQQALSSRPDVASVAAYYATLNLSKCYLLASPLHTRLDAKLGHGASYHTYAKDSHTLLTESIKLQSQGVIPSLYEVITGSAPPACFVKVRDIYRYIPDIGSEWSIATDTDCSVATVRFDCAVDASGARTVKASLSGTDKPSVSLKALPAFVGLKRLVGGSNEFVGLPDTTSKTDDEAASKLVRRFLLYDAHSGHPQVPVGGQKLLVPQEIPIVLAFYHLSSISRYNPEFMARIRDSRHWPLVVSLQWHALQKYLILTWSFLQQKNVLVNAESSLF